ncbi:hypothetical protein GW916_10380 [bacterium]|nr:hypothetical protein [bacterium]
MGFWDRQLSLFSSLTRNTNRETPTAVAELPLQVPAASNFSHSVGLPQRKKRKSHDRVATLNNEFHALMWEIAQSISEFSNFDFRRLKVSVGTSRSRGKIGIWAYVTPLRYIGGSLYRKGRRYGVAGRYTYELKGVDLESPDAPLYLITVLVPRFFSLSFDERIETLVHELYHVHPDFRGDLRRFPRPHVHHGPTPRAFNNKVKQFTKEALARDPSLREHPLLASDAASFSHLKRKRVASPTLKFIPSKFGLMGLVLALAFSMGSYSGGVAAQDDGSAAMLGQKSSRSQSTESVDPNSTKAPMSSKPVDPQAHFIGNVEYFDMTHQGATNPRYIVQPKETLRLRAAPSEWATPMHEVTTKEKFLAYTIDETGQWVLLRSRNKQGWYPKDKLSVIGQLGAPNGGGSFDAVTGSRSGSKLSNSIRRDGDRVYLPTKAEWGTSDITKLDGGVDNVTAKVSGSFYETPNPLATQFGIIEKGDKLEILKQDRTQEWTYVRLGLTKEEGWFPSEKIQIVRGMKVQSAGLGRVVVDVDGNWGTTGRNLGFGVGAMWGFASRSSLYARRFEVGAFYQQSLGEALTIEGDVNTYSLSTAYSLLGILARYLAFSSGGLIGGALELGGSYQRTQADLSGLDDDIINNSGIVQSTAPRFGVTVGLRGLVSVSRTVQVNTLLRANIADSSNTYWGGLGLSFRF